MASARRVLSSSCLLVLLVLVWFPAGTLAARAAAGPEFLEQEQLSIPLERVPGGRWDVVVINPGAAAAVEVRLAGSLADALAVQGGRAYVAGGGSATFRLVPGRRPHAGTGELVLISADGVDRLRVTVTPPAPFLTRYPFVPVLGGLLLLAGFVALPLWRRRRTASGESRPPRTGGAVRPGLRGFTHSDEPAHADELNRAEYARHLAELARHATPPMVIGVYGEWGTGKTSMLMQVRDELRDAPECAHVWFDPWRHQYDENPVLPLLHVIVNDLGLAGRENVRRTLRTISDVLGSLVMSASFKINFSDVRKSMEDYDAEHFRVRSELTRLDEHLGELIDEALAARGKQRLIVFVDDLDRCDADRITSLLEVLKLHFNRNNCVFVLALAKGPLMAAVREKYQDPVGDYLDKIIQFPFEMPRLSERDFTRYLDGLLTLTDDIRAAGGMLRCGLRRNPRAVKRFVNVLILQDRVAKARKLDPYDVSVLAAVLLLRDGAPKVYAELMDDPSLLQRIAWQLGAPEAGEPGEPGEWGGLATRIVRELAGSPAGVPDDVRTYIDLVRDSPLPQPGDLSDGPPQGRPEVPELIRLNELSLKAVLESLAAAVRERTGRPAGDGPRVLDPVVRFRGQDHTGMAAVEDAVTRGGAKLLVTGPPGAGKTVLAERLAAHLAERRAPQSPAFLPFAALKTEFPEHDRWVTHALVSEYRISLPDANAMVRRGSLSLILDGLDTLDQDKRAAFLQWARDAACGVVITSRDGPVPGLEEVRMLGVPATEVRRQFEAALAAHGIEPDRLLGLTSELLSSPQLLTVLTGGQKWIEDLPDQPVRFVPWYADWTLRATAAAGFAPDAVAQGLRDLARSTRHDGHHMFSGEDSAVRTVLWRAGVRTVEAPALLAAATRAGLLRECGPRVYHFLHPLLREHLAGLEL
ncbi:P-loop NTPase fold protein [Nonomuraea spiralis]|uniref:P-loop NTPase fold protein n=1 Tax=Nonomuraea spiralis TaxID=46182 RepID=A0ABV5IDY9_9ACTN|nr:P-loop NTPase fold protein [Nonomuraea spiralis]GGS68117.1 hypothetical protein GCM10010176_008120 [Nonomuraea spiralis]